MAVLTEKQIKDLNRMNQAAQNVQLGTLLDNLLSGIASGLNWINLDETSRAKLMEFINEQLKSANADINKIEF